MQAASHKFDLFGNNYPAISWSERIAELRKSIGPGQLRSP